MSLAIPLPPHENQTAFNIAAWQRILANPALEKIDGRIESNRHGHIIMTPPPGFSHGSRQSEIAVHLKNFLGAHVVTECPVSTSDGVKGIDVAWISPGRRQRALRDQLLVEAPEICVEVLCPSNTGPEMQEKIALYFDAGADEAWICDLEGLMHFHGPGGPLAASSILPAFPGRIVV
jgi:Uma2 family endonuclease